MRDLIWLAPDREVYTVSVIEEPWDEGHGTATIVFRCDRTGWTGAIGFEAAGLTGSMVTEDLPLLLRHARARG